MHVIFKSVSSISHMTYHNGAPCDKYVAIVRVRPLKRTGWGITDNLYLHVFAPTESALCRKLNQFRTESTVEIGTENLFKTRGIAYGTTD